MPQSQQSGGIGGPIISGDVGLGDGGGAFSGGPATARGEFSVLDFELLDPPSSPSAGDAYTVGGSARGAWTAWDYNYAICNDDLTWRRKLAVRGSRAFKELTGEWRTCNGRTWDQSTVLGVARDGLTASPTQAQGQVPLGHSLNTFATVATTGDAATLPPASKGVICIVVNNAANDMKLFPAAGHSIDALSANAAFTVVAAKRTMFLGISGSAWATLTGA